MRTQSVCTSLDATSLPLVAVRKGLYCDDKAAKSPPVLILEAIL